MSKISQPSLASLETRLAAIETELRKRNPDLFDEWQFVSRRIASRRSDSGDDFAEIKTPLEAFNFCLRESKHGWMTKRAIVDRLLAGGFIKTRAQEWKMNTLLNYHSNPKEGDNFQRVGDDGKWEMLIGLKGKPKPK